MSDMDSLVGALAAIHRVQRYAEVTRPVWSTCPQCRAYADRRRDRIAGDLADKAMAEGREAHVVVDEFMDKVHQRHLDGLPI